jgi:6-pyruvoyltetrahydropterin/6-carboxytetrahydropterin synthase
MGFDRFDGGSRRRRERRIAPMGYFIGKRFSFAAAHCLPSLPSDHKCGREHGHTYTIEVVLTADRLVPPGFVTEFADLAPLENYIESTLDHRHLNKVLDFEPTSEALAYHLAQWFKEHVEPTIAARLVSMRVRETPSSWAEYTVKAD